jgi:hypothetical protein
MQLKHDYLDFYRPMLEDVRYLLNVSNTFDVLPNKDEFEDTVRNLKSEFDKLGDRYEFALFQNTKQFLVDYATAAGDPEIAELIQQISDPKNDISWLGKFFGQYSKSSSKVIRIMENMVRNQNNKTQRNTFTEGTRLVELLKAAVKESKKSSAEVMSLMQEKDKNGLPTGNFVRDLNYGQMQQDEEAASKKICEDMNLVIDMDGQIAFENYQRKQEYNRRMNKWYEKHVNRRYVSEYYAARNELKEATVDALNAAQKDINYLMDRYTQNGIFYTDQMDAAEKAKLNLLLK